MVDLVKIRKRAREQKESEAESSAETTGSETPDAGTDAAEIRNSGSSPKKQKKRARGNKKSAAESGSSSSSTGEDSPGLADTTSAAEETTAPTGRGDDDAELRTGTSRTDNEVQQEDGESRLSRFKRTAGVMEQSEADEEVVEHDASDDLLELITFTLEGEQYAMDVDRLVEIIVPRSATRVPNATEEVIGIISLRGSIVTLLDLRRILGHEGSAPETEDTRIVVVQYENERIGFIVDKVLRVVKVDRSSIEPHPVVSAAEQNDAVHGVFVSGDTITIYLDLDRIAG